MIYRDDCGRGMDKLYVTVIYKDISATANGHKSQYHSKEAAMRLLKNKLRLQAIGWKPEPPCEFCYAELEGVSSESIESV